MLPDQIAALIKSVQNKSKISNKRTKLEHQNSNDAWDMHRFYECKKPSEKTTVPQYAGKSPQTLTRKNHFRQVFIVGRDLSVFYRIAYKKTWRGKITFSDLHFQIFRKCHWTWKDDQIFCVKNCKVHRLRQCVKPVLSFCFLWFLSGCGSSVIWHLLREMILIFPSNFIIRTEIPNLVKNVLLSRIYFRL